MQQDQFLDSPLWHFSLKFYSRPRVPPACLTLQDIAGVDVCVLLFSLYCTHTKRFISQQKLCQCDERLRDWRSTVILPLRRIRRDMKTKLATTVLESMKNVRQQIQSLEINAERISLAILYEEFQSLSQDNAKNSDTATLLNAVVAIYGAAERVDRSTPEGESVHSAIATLSDELLQLSRM
mgnify:CR=1 FL=1